MRAKFALALPSGSKPGATVPLPLIDVRVQWSTRHQDNAAQHAPMRKFSLRTLSSLSDALVSAQWRKIGYRQRFLTTTASGNYQCQRTAKAPFALEALDRYN